MKYAVSVSLACAVVMTACTQDWQNDKDADVMTEPDAARGIGVVGEPDAGAMDGSRAGDPDATFADATLPDAGIPTGEDGAVLASCTPNPCRNGGACSLDNNTALCRCAAGYEGNDCSQDIDECAGNHGCDPRYPCRNFPGGYMCLGQTADWPIPKRSTVAGSDLTVHKLVVNEAAGTLLDQVTGLMWQRAARDISDTNYAAASKHCDESTLAGFDDWRVPSLHEMATFWATERVPAYLGLAEPVRRNMWTKTEGGAVDTQLLVTMDDPYMYAMPLDTASVYHLCVRTNEVRVSGSPAQRFVVAKDLDNTVYDTRTQLTWQREADAAARDYNAAVTYCASLKTGNLSWHLPTMVELLSLFDLKIKDVTTPQLNRLGFAGPAGYYWSSTVRVGTTPTAHIMVYFDYAHWRWSANGDGTSVGGDPPPPPPAVHTRCVADGVP